ncbi:plasma-membrane choline transporter family protein [Nitzschia inconspicua]|uniref:Choline transporter-like protein n=1 Tax=Nitzschia inconspicua TaxID=303405 RepID=A0A9K3L574_9STRA|nr:plasma-membrane choline transporter family protein [Nitzschia inconspicua]
MSSPTEPPSSFTSPLDEVSPVATANLVSDDGYNKGQSRGIETIDALQEPLLPATDDNPNTSFLPFPPVAGNDTESASMHAALLIDDSNWEHYGQAQSKACRDWFWGVLFLLQLTVVFVLAVMGGINLVKEGAKWMPYNDDDSPDGGDSIFINGAVIFFFLTLVTVVVIISALLLKLLLGALSQMMIQLSLTMSPLCFGITFVLALVTFNIPLAFFALFMSAFGVFYAWGVWHRIPFATANLNIAMAALDANHGLWILAYAMTFKAYLYTMIWCCTFLQVFVYSPSWVYDCTHYSDDPSSDTCRLSTRGHWIVVACLLSLFWTSQVLKNLFHTTIAGVLGTWWFDPADSHSRLALDAAVGNENVVEERPSAGIACCKCCGCSPIIYDSWVRSSWYSFGSICLGSLLVGLLQVLQLLVRCGRQQQQDRREQEGPRGLQAGDLFCCLLQCIVDNLEFLLRYFNQWAFVYVGLYGYDYITAGTKVSNLFQDRGWSNIINHQLIGRALAMMSILIGFVCGAVGTLVGFIFLGPLGALPTFFIGMVLGGLSCNILFGVVVSAVNTIVVCFAESPNELLRNHPPELYRELVEAWRKAYPQECGF